MASDAIKVILRSTKSSHFYTTTKNKRNKEKIKIMKYDPIVREHVEYVEERMK